MTQAFFQKYFPTHKTNSLKRQISNFAQKESETLYQVWKRYKDLLNSCPHHGYESWRVVSYFYDGLLSRERQFIETMCNGEFLHKDPDEAIDFLDDLSEKAHTWTRPNAIESTKKTQTAGIYQLKEEDSLKARLEALTKEIEVLKTKDTRAPEPVARVESHEPCFMCNELDHTLRECLTYFEIKEIKEENSALKGEILKQLKQVRINLPFLHVIKQVPNYAKVIKDLCTLKRKHNVKKMTFLAEQASVVIDNKTPPKYKDPGCPTVPCQIGNQACGQALLDLGASVNLMPYSVYLQLGLGEIKPTTVVLQLADRLVRKPRGIVEDVLVQIDKFYYPIDFLVLDTIAIVNTESKIPLILGRPFLATANALINCRNGLMTLSFGNMTLESQGFVKKSWQPCFEELLKEREPPKPSSEEVPTPTLALLPKGLKHAFLGPGDIFPVIISSELSDVQSDKLLDLLREHKSTLGWTIADIKGISPLICSHRIYLEEGANPR
ncbi:hypothetical protein UlMin_041717 [Ulmus minor]